MLYAVLLLKIGTKSPVFQREELRLQRTADFQIRQSKRDRKGKKIRAFDDDVAGNTREKVNRGGAKKGKLKTTFTDQLTSVGQKAVKRFRHGFVTTYLLMCVFAKT